nr:MAG TPA: hypothetical protein [Bacteriophage sp.]
MSIRAYIKRLASNHKSFYVLILTDISNKGKE